MLERVAQPRGRAKPANAAQVRLVERREGRPDASKALSSAPSCARGAHVPRRSRHSSDAICELVAPGADRVDRRQERRGVAARSRSEGDWAAAIGASTAIGGSTASVSTPAATASEHLSSLIADRGVEPVSWYGVASSTDGSTPDRPPNDPEDLVFPGRARGQQRDLYRRVSPLFHLIGPRPLAPVIARRPQDRASGATATSRTRA